MTGFMIHFGGKGMGGKGREGRGGGEGRRGRGIWLLTKREKYKLGRGGRFFFKNICFVSV